MKIVSWNVAGFRACLNKGFKEFFEEVNADIFCLQEVKAERNEIDFAPANYFEYHNEAFKKGYSGVTIYTKKRPLKVKYGLGILEYDKEGRMITLEYLEFFLINVYVPNVKRDLSRLEYRMKWEEEFLEYVKGLRKEKPVIICGDFNVAHEEIDLKNAKSNIGKAGFTYEEREKFSILLNNKMVDAFRYLNPKVKDVYSWWSYREGLREKNIGWRIDYFIISDNIVSNLIDVYYHKDILGSDHCPVELTIDLKFR